MKNTNYIDLHMHSIESIDGTFTPNELIDIAKQSHIKYMAVSDHDVTESVEEAICIGKQNDIVVIPAIEISCDYNGTPLHILGYGIDHNNIAYKNRTIYIRDQIKGYAKKNIDIARKNGFYLNDDEVYNFRKDHLVCEEFVAQAIFNDPRNNNDPRLLPYRKGGQLSDNPTFNFYKDFYTYGKPCYVEHQGDMPLKDAAELIHSTGGKMFLAHPKHNIGYSDELLKEIMSFGLQGIEVFSSYHDVQATQYYYNKAKEYNLYMSVGSDFHGNAKPSIKMGSIDYDETQLIKTLKYLGYYID